MVNPEALEHPLQALKDAYGRLPPDQIAAKEQIKSVVKKLADKAGKAPPL